MTAEGLTMAKAKDVLGPAKDKQAVMVDLKFMDFVVLWQHFTIPIVELTEGVFDEGLNELKKDHDFLLHGCLRSRHSPGNPS